jgi:uncharacterized membrane protein YqiK
MNMVFGILGFGLLLLATGLAIVFGGFEAPVAVTAVFLMGGGFISAVGGSMLIVTKLYVKTKASEAYVRTGWRGAHVIKDGGSLVFPVIHELIRVPLKTVRLEVKRLGEGALITLDNLRVDIQAEFFVRVDETENKDGKFGGILQAARSLGESLERPEDVKRMVEDKLISALRSVAAQKKLSELHSDREGFIKLVSEQVRGDLAQNGLILEGATISSLDMTSKENLRGDNYFDAQGLTTITEVEQEHLTQRNKLERDQELARERKNVETEQAILEQKRIEAEAKAKQKADIEAAEAAEQRRAEEAVIEKAKRLKVATEKAQAEQEIAEQNRLKATTVATEQAEQAREVAAEERRKAKEVAQQEADKARQVAEQERAQAVAAAQQAAAEAEAARQAAEAEAEAARQKVRTVEVTETAKRQKEERVINAQAEAETKFVSDQREADAKAYEVEKQAEAKKAAADAEAEAVKKAADAAAAAERARAEAARDAQVAKAKGEEAEQMVPVNVDEKRVAVDRDRAMIEVDVRAKDVKVAAEQVEVDKRRVDEVLTPELEAREKSGRVAQEFELDKQRIAADQAVETARAQAMGEAFGKMTMQVIGGADQAAAMLGAMLNGQNIAGFANGLAREIDPNIVAKAIAAGMTGKALLAHVAEKMGLEPAKLLGELAKGPAQIETTPEA